MITHDYPLIKSLLSVEEIRLGRKEDIAAIKLNAISGNGTRSKDFVDIYYLLQEYTVSELIGFYKEKYSSRNELHVLKSLIYFEDIDLSDWPKLKDNKLTLKKVKHFITQKVRESI